MCIIFSTGRKTWVFFTEGDKKVEPDGCETFYKVELEKLITETHDLGILDLIYKILLQAKK